MRTLSKGEICGISARDNDDVGDKSYLLLSPVPRL